MKCERCYGTGVVFTQEGDVVYIKKCDTCEMYVTNVRAAQAVANTWEEMNRD